MSDKFENLKKYLGELESFAVAFSGGVDSTFLLKVAHDLLGEKIIAVTIDSEFLTRQEVEETKNFCELENIKQIFCKVEALKIDGLKENPKNRCYVCKKNLFQRLLKIADENNLKYVVEGSNADDTKDFRPGFQAIKELDIKSPLLYAGLTKNEIRELSKNLNLQTWDKPSFACLASRFVFGENITREKLEIVAQAENFLRQKNFSQFRVRIHDKMARIEILPSEFEKIFVGDMREEILKKFKNFGFSYVALDLQGYRTGSMNEVIL